MKRIVMIGIILILNISSGLASNFFNNNAINALSSFSAAFRPYYSAGFPDQIFGSDGAKTYHVSGNDVGKKVIELPNGSYVLAGTSAGGTAAMLLFVDIHGVVTKTVPTTGDDIFGLVRSDSRIYLLVQNSAVSTVIAYDFSGNIDTAFGTAGYQNVGNNATAVSMLYYKGSLFVLANDGSNEIYKISATTGDTVSGFTTINLTTNAFTDSVAAMDIYNGEIYVVGKETASTLTKVRKYNATTGAQVTSGFGTSGVATTAQSVVATSISVDQTTGEIYVVRASSPTGNAVVHKFKADGTADTAWASAGIYTKTSFGTPTAIIAVSGGVQYIIGYSATPNGKVARINNGVDDADFLYNGVRENTSLTHAYGAVTTSVGQKLVVVGKDASDAKLWRLMGGTKNDSPVSSNHNSGHGAGMTGAPR